VDGGMWGGCMGRVHGERSGRRKKETRGSLRRVVFIIRGCVS
jgi:hypothetical protein